VRKTSRCVGRGAPAQRIGSCGLISVPESMTSAESSDRTVCPHALVEASGRYHVRAFDFARKRFIDFSLSRVLSSTPLVDDAAVPSKLDDDWHAMIDVGFVPHPRLSPAQRLTIAREFGMDDGMTIVRVRRALLFYLLDEMRMLGAVRNFDEALADVPVWVKDPRRARWMRRDAPSKFSAAWVSKTPTCRRSKEEAAPRRGGAGQVSVTCETSFGAMLPILNSTARKQFGCFAWH